MIYRIFHRLLNCFGVKNFEYLLPISTIVIKLYATKYISQIRNHQKLRRFSKNIPPENGLEIYLVYDRFYLKILRPIFQSLGINHFWTILAQNESFSNFDENKNLCSNIFPELS